MEDKFAGDKETLNSPATRAVAVVPDNDDDLAAVTRALYVGASGDLTVILRDDDASVTFKGFSGLLPARVKRVLATGTTATDIVALV